MSSWGHTGRVRGPGAVAVRQQGGRLSPSCPEPASPSAADVVDENIGEYCSLDKGGKRPQRELTTGEKEQLFLEAMMVRRRSRSDRLRCRLDAFLAWRGYTPPAL